MSSETKEMKFFFSPLLFHKERELMHESPVSSALGPKRAKMAGWSDDYSADGSALRSVLRQKEIKQKKKKKKRAD